MREVFSNFVARNIHNFYIFMKIQISDESVRKYNNAFDNCRRLIDEMEELIKFIIHKQPSQRIIIPFCIDEVYGVDGNYCFFVDEDEEVCCGLESNNDKEISDCEPISFYPDSMYKSLIMMSEKVGENELSKIKNRISAVQSAYIFVKDSFIDVFKSIIIEQPSKYIIEAVPMEECDDGLPYRFTTNEQGEIIYYKDKSQNGDDYMEDIKFLHKILDVTPISPMIGMLDSLRFDFDKEVNTYGVI